MLFEDRFDAYHFLKNGHFRSRLNTARADFLLRILRRFDYVDMPSDHCDAGPRQRALLETCSGAATALERIGAKVLGQDLKDLGDHYCSPPDRKVLTALRLGDGYSLDWHNHLAAGCSASVLVYLFDDLAGGEGGDLVLGEVARDLKTVRETERFSVRHGDVIVIGDASHPLMMHKAEPWRGAGHRYLLSLAFNADDW